MMSNDYNKDSFMFFGHEIDPNDKANLFLSNYNTETFSSVNKHLVKGKELWDQIILDILEKSGNDKIVVPLSGGLDSRLLIAGLLKHVSPKEISTYTFGAEGSMDFTIGNMVAKKIGTNHFASPISIDNYTLENEIIWSGMVQKPTTLFFHPPLDIIEQFEDHNFWFGYMGDPLAGSHLLSHIKDLESATAYYIKKYGSVSVEKAKSYGIDLNGVSKIIEKSIDKNREINIFENIDFSIRQHQYIYPHVVFSKKHSIPFIDSRWIDYMLTVPNSLRENEVFYREFMMKSYPDIFSLPCKNNLGYKLGSRLSIIPKIEMKLFPSAKKKMINYLDFDAYLKSNNNDFSKFIKELLFVNEGIGQFDKNDIQKIWNDYIKGEINYGIIFNILSYAIHFQNK